MIKQLSNSKTGGVFLIVLAIMLNACVPTAAARAVYATACSLPTGESNVYRQLPPTNLITYYQTAFSPPPNIPFDENFTEQQYKAFRLLATQVKRWSDFIDFPASNKYVIYLEKLETLSTVASRQK